MWSPDDRFWDHVDKSGGYPPDPYRPVVGQCWVWTGALARGYGWVNRRGDTQLAHRVTFYAATGETPEELDHVCRVRSCVNPDHLEGVSHAENMARTRSERCGRGHLFTPETTVIKRRYYGETRGCRLCTREDDRRRYHARRGAHV